MTDDPYEEIQPPPQDLHAEQATLGGMMVEPGAAERVVATGLQEGDFYRVAHRRIFAAAVTVLQRREPVDILTVTAELRDKGQYDDAGGAAYLATLIRETPTAAHVVRYAQIVREKAALRELIVAAPDIQRLGYSNRSDVHEVLHEAEALVAGIRRRWTEGMRSMAGGGIDELVSSEGRLLLERWGDPQGVTGPRFGIRAFDEDILGGLPCPGLVVVRAETSYGKTALLVQCAGTTAMYGLPAAYFDLETTRGFILQKLVQQYTGIDAHWRKTIKATSDQLYEAGRAMNAVAQWPLHIESPGQIDFPALRGRIMDIHREQPRALYVVDFLQKVRLTGGRGAWEALAATVNELQTLARELDTTVLVGSQVTRTDYGDYKTRGARDIEHTCDVLLTIRKALPKRAKGEPNVDARDEGQAERASPIGYLVVDKHRQGSVGSVPVYWDPSWQRFFSLREAGQYVHDIGAQRAQFAPEDWREIEAGMQEPPVAPWIEYES